MNIVVAGPKVQIYGEDVKTYKKLPAQSYQVCFDQNSGFFLTPFKNICANENKIYGKHQEKVDKVIRSFEQTNRNFGVILSGDKGIGKSLFVRLLAENCHKKDIPVILVPEYFRGCRVLFLQLIRRLL